MCNMVRLIGKVEQSLLGFPISLEAVRTRPQKEEKEIIIPSRAMGFFSKKIVSADLYYIDNSISKYTRGFGGLIKLIIQRTHLSSQDYNQNKFEKNQN